MEVITPGWTLSGLAILTGYTRGVGVGVFVGVEDGIDGLVHISDLSWTKRVKHPSEMFKKGQEIEVMVLNIDVEHEKFSLGLKQIEKNPGKYLKVTKMSNQEYLETEQSLRKDGAQNRK